MWLVGSRRSTRSLASFSLLVATFGQGRKSILSAGTYMGMAAASVLEPMVLLYRFTSDECYLEFARYVVQAWNEPNGPKIVHALLRAKQVNRTANGKAYEMLSNLVGLCELARATGDRSLLTPVLNAASMWEYLSLLLSSSTFCSGVSCSWAGSP